LHGRAGCSSSWSRRFDPRSNHNGRVGFGFLHNAAVQQLTGNHDLFFHSRQVRQGVPLVEGSLVSFRLIPAPDGRYYAKDVDRPDLAKLVSAD